MRVPYPATWDALTNPRCALGAAGSSVSGFSVPSLVCLTLSAALSGACLVGSVTLSGRPPHSTPTMSDKSRKHCSLLLIANIAVMVAAAGRQNPRNIPVRATPRPTRTKGAHGLTSLQVSHRPTKAPDLAASANLRRRQADPAICGYFPFHIESMLSN